MDGFLGPALYIFLNIIPLSVIMGFDCKRLQTEPAIVREKPLALRVLPLLSLTENVPKNKISQVFGITAPYSSSVSIPMSSCKANRSLPLNIRKLRNFKRKPTLVD